MNEKVYEALEVCIEALETGADPESVVKRFPEMKADLLPLLETSQQARMLAMPKVPEVVLHRGRARLLQHAAGMRETASKPQTQKTRFTFPRLAVSLAIAFLFFLSGTGLVSASGGALPGDNLYPVKRTWEDVRLVLVFNPVSREELEDEFERERLHEIDELLAEGRHETIGFAGVVTEQKGDLWVVSGVPVQIIPASRLPGTPVTVGTSVMLQGRTNVRGFVEVDYIELLGSNVVLPTSVPTQIDTGIENSDHGNTSLEEDDNGHVNEAEAESSSGEDRDNSGSEDKHDESDNSNSDRKDNYSEEDRSGESSGNGRKGHSEDDESEHSSLGGGSDGTNNENRD